MAAILGFDESDIGIGKNLLPRFRKNADEGIIGRVQNQRRNGNAVHNVGGGRASVIIRCALKAAIVGGDLVVEIAQGGHTPQTRQGRMSPGNSRAFSSAGGAVAT